MTVDSNLGATMDKEEGAVTSTRKSRKNCSSVGDCQRRSAGFLQSISGTRKFGRREMKP